MKITTDKAVNSAIAYMSGEIAKVPNLRDRFLMFAALGAIKTNPAGIVATYAPILKTVGVMPDDGSVDTDALKSAFSMAFSNVPKVTVAGFTFGAQDAQNLIAKMEA